MSSSAFECLHIFSPFAVLICRSILNFCLAHSTRQCACVCMCMCSPPLPCTVCLSCVSLFVQNWCWGLLLFAPTWFSAWLEEAGFSKDVLLGALISSGWWLTVSMWWSPGREAGPCCTPAQDGWVGVWRREGPHLQARKKLRPPFPAFWTESWAESPGLYSAEWDVFLPREDRAACAPWEERIRRFCWSLGPLELRVHQRTGSHSTQSNSLLLPGWNCLIPYLLFSFLLNHLPHKHPS